MKRFILLLCVTLFAFGCANEQKRIDKMASKMVNTINTACQLTPDQQTKVKDAASAFVKAKMENADKYAQNQEILINRNAAAKNDYVAQLKSVLTPDQLDKLKTYHEQHKEEPQGKESE